MADHIDIRLTDNSAEAKRAMDGAIRVALEAIGMQAEGYAKMKCPVDTGRLRNSISHAYSGSEKAEYIGTNVEYAPYVELGTKRMPARPYLKPAVADHGPEYKRIIETYLKNS